ncbi:apc-like protein [Dermatophagoides farinae]|uniref:Apc-like protein n=1 Tax=Dermatophagoides farinae TaxID=6954 RepID=A0A9D4SJS9_DERFA|nr:apc-like protein [Dermatophagoides farinae]
MLSSLLEMMKLSSLEEFAKKLCFMSESPLLCQEMRDCGYVPMLIRLINQKSIDDQDDVDLQQLQRQSLIHRNLVQALNNIIQHTKRNRKELKILKILVDLKAFVEILLKKFLEHRSDSTTVESVDHPCNLIIDLYRMCTEKQSIELIEFFGGVFIISEVIKIDYKCHGGDSNPNEDCYRIRLYSLMILTHVTYNNPQVKSLLGSKKSFLLVLIELLSLSNEDLIEAIAKVIQNLSWDTNYISMQTMRDLKTVTHLTTTMLNVKKESTIKCLLSALGNLTASSPQNKADFCRVNGALEFLIKSMKLSADSNGNVNDDKTMINKSSVDNGNRKQSKNGDENKNCKISISVVEASGRILRNISSYLAMEERYRQILRKHNVIVMLLNHLESSSLDIVSNACVTLSNLSVFTLQTEESSNDQILMIESNAITKLAKLFYSKHRTIRIGAMATYKHLVTSQAYLIHSTFNNVDGGGNGPNHNQQQHHHNKLSTSLSISSFPMRKIKAIKNEISNLSSNNHHHHVDDDDDELPVDLSKSFNFGSTTTTKTRFPRSTSHDSIRNNQLNGQTIIMTKSTPDSFLPTYHHHHHHSINKSNGSFTTKSLCNVNRKCQSPSTTTSRISCDNNHFIISDGISSDYDIYSGDVKSGKTTSESVAEDSVKIYETEGTPLAFSLAPSLSDLHEIDLKSIYEDERENEQIVDEPKKTTKLKSSSSSLKATNSSSHHHDNDDDGKTTKIVTNNNNNLSPINITSTIKLNRNVSRISSTKSSTMQESNVEKPMLPPKPTNVVENQTIKTDKNNNNTQWTTTTNNTKSSMNGNIEKTDGEYFNDGDVAIKFETEDTPAIFSHATSLSSLDVDDDEQSIIVEPSSAINVLITSNVEQSIDDNDEKQNKNETIDVDKNLEKCKNEKDEIRKKNEDQKQKQSSSSSIIMKNEIKSESDDDDDEDEQILKKCIEFALPTKKKSNAHSSSSSTLSPAIATTATNSNVSHNKNSGNSRSLYSHKSSPRSVKQQCTSNKNSPQLPTTMMMMNHHNNSSSGQQSTTLSLSSSQQQSPLLRNKSSISTKQSMMIDMPSSGAQSVGGGGGGGGDQRRQFFVEDTPIQFSECHSSLSSLSFDSDNGIGNNNNNNETATATVMIAPNPTINNNNNRENNKEPHPPTTELLTEPSSSSSSLKKVPISVILRDDDVDDYQLLDAVIKLGIDSNVNTSSSSSSSGHNVAVTTTKTAMTKGGPRSSLLSSVVSTTPALSSSSMAHRQKNLSTKNNVTKTTVIQQQDGSSSHSHIISLPKNHHHNFRQPTTFINLAQSNMQNTQLLSNRSNRMADNHQHHHHHHHHHNYEDDDDEKTYTICTQAQCQSSFLYPQRQSADGQSSQCQQQQQQQQQLQQQPIISTKNSPRKPKRENTTTTTSVTNRTSPANKTKMIPIPTTRTTIQNKNNQQQQQQPRPQQQQQQLQPINISGNNGDQSDTGSFDDRSIHSLLDNTKPPSIIDHHSLMSQSSASIDSEISDIDIDNVPIRNTNSQDLLVAKAASNCAKEIHSLVQSCMDNNYDDDDEDLSEVKDSSSSLSTADGGGYHHHHQHRHHNRNLSVMKTYNRDNGDGQQSMSTIHHTFQVRNNQQQQQQQQAQSRTLPKMKITQHSEMKSNTSNDDEIDNGFDQRTYNKNDIKRNNKDQPKQQKLMTGFNYYESDQSDTDISEILPLDDCDPSSLNPVDNNNSVQINDTATTTTTNESNTATIVLYNKPNIDPNPSSIDPFLAQMLSTPPTAAAATAAMINKPKTTKSLTSSSSSTSTMKQNHQIYPKSSASVHSFGRYINNNDNGDESYGGHQLERLEDMESETRYRPHSRNRSSSNNRMEELDFTNGFNQQFYPFNSHHDDRSMNFKQNSRSLNRGHKFMTNNTKADFEDRDLMFTSKHRKQVVQSHARYFQNKSSSTATTAVVKTSSKYFDRHPIVGADAAETNTEMELLMDDSPPRLPSTRNHHHHHHSQLPQKQQQQQFNNNNPISTTTTTTTTKSKEKSLLSNIKSKLFSSPKPDKKSVQNKSKIKFWPRSKSTHDKLNEQQQQQQQQQSSISDTSKPPLPLNRNLLKQPLSINGGSQELINDHDYSDKSSGSMFNRLIPIRSNGSNHYKSQSLIQQPESMTMANKLQTNNNFTFMTFVKTPCPNNNNNNENSDNNSNNHQTLMNVNSSMSSNENENRQKKNMADTNNNTNNGNLNEKRKPTNQSSNRGRKDSSTDSSISTSSSSNANRKTCLVTTV